MNDEQWKQTLDEITNPHRAQDPRLALAYIQSLADLLETVADIATPDQVTAILHSIKRHAAEVSDWLED